MGQSEESRLWWTQRLRSQEDMLSSSSKQKETFKVSLVWSWIDLIIIAALERGNGRRVDGARVLVDYERGRTKSDWIPRRLGGGKGDKRRDRETERLIREIKKTHPFFNPEEVKPEP